MGYFKILLFSLLIIFNSCTTNIEELESNNMSFNFEDRYQFQNTNDSLQFGKTYLSVYSQIYSRSENNIRNLTATVSLRNTSSSDSLFVQEIIYYNTEGAEIKSYIANTIYLKPLETIEIIIEEDDKAGGTGGNFIFNWSISASANKPIFEAVMISTAGQQGISFTTSGIILE